jgi:redox-sensitive bicupin YhaK (pirin superfamily)
MPVIYHPEMTRSFRDLGKVKLYQSFHSYYPPAPNRRNLGAMVALDNIHYLPGDSETCTFPHQNTEVLTLVLQGTVISKDNTGCTYTLTRNTALLLSAGTGIEITNCNGSLTEEADLLQMRY